MKIFFALTFVLALNAQAQVNSWTNSSPGNWAIGSSWSAGLPTNSQSCFFTNAFSKTVTVNTATVASNAVNSCMTVSNLTVNAPASPASFNTLALNNAGLATPLRVRDTFTILDRGFLTMGGSALQVDQTFVVEGFASMLSGTCHAVTTYVGNNATGQVIVSSGLFQSTNVNVGYSFQALGTLTIAGGSNQFQTLGLAGSPTAQGFVWMTNGVLRANSLSVDANGSGQVIVSNGMTQFNEIYLGVAGRGTLTFAGGTNFTTGEIRVGGSTTGTVWITGGLVVATNAEVNVGYFGNGTLTLSNGTLLAGTVHVARFPGSFGSLTVAGGTFTANQLIATNFAVVHFPGGNTTLRGAQVGTSQLISVGEAGRTALLNLTLTGTNRFGEFAAASGVGSTGIVTLSGGVLLSTNDLFSTRIGSSGVGQMTITNSTFVVDRLVVGYNNGAQGTLSLMTGSSLQCRVLTLGLDFNATGTVWVTSNAQLITTNGRTVLGDHGSGRLILSNGLWQADQVRVGNSIAAAGTLTIAGGTSVIASNLVVGLFATATGTVWVTGGQLLSTNFIGGNETIIASNGMGQAIISNGLVRTYSQIIGAGSAGTLTMAGGTNHVGGDLFLGKLAGATGTVWLTGGRLEVNDGSDPLVILGDSGVGRMTVSNGTWLSRYVFVGGTVGGSGTLTIAGGTNIFDALFGIAVSSGATGVVWMTGGQLTTTNASARVGNVSIGQMTVSNGTWRARDVSVGAFSGARGTLTVAGGNSVMSSNLILGASDCTATGIVGVVGGNLFVTNAAGNATLEVRSGTFTMSGGIVRVDKFVITNACAHFARTGGTLIYSNVVLIASRDDDADGIQNGYEQSHGFDPLNAADANVDSDGDGQTNLEEFQAGTDATNSATVFQITAIRREGVDIRVTWDCVGNFVYMVQTNSPPSNGSYTNNFSNLSSLIFVTSVATSTNYLHSGGATNRPALFYRVRLIPGL